MSTLSIKPHTRNIELPSINIVEASRPLVWLRMGFSDFLHDWPLSLATGALFALIGYGLLQFAAPRPHLIMTLTTGFLAVSPFLAIVFYELSRRREKPHTKVLFSGLLRNSRSLGLFAVMLAFILSSWERLSAIMVALFLKDELISGYPFAFTTLFDSQHLSFLVPYTLAAVVMGALVFSLSVVSLPMMIDRKVDIATAITTSLWVVRENPLTMLVWAVVIAGLTLFGQWALLVPLAIIFPLLGHASWHAYRDLVGRY